jgi:RNA polymerase sigma-70 factor (ECF subfamily)
MNDVVASDRSPPVLAPAVLRLDTSAGEAALDFESVYVAHFHHVARWARALGGLDADVDDLTQDVFLVVRRRLGDYRGPSMKAWLYGITKKTVSDYRRRAWLRRWLGGQTRSLDDSNEARALSAPDRSEHWEARRILSRVLERMTPLRRSAFVLFEIEGYSGEEIAEMEQIPVATAYTRLHHARKDYLRLVAELTGSADEEVDS